MRRIAYLDVIGGISGDMLLAAIIDAGVSKAQLIAEISRVTDQRFDLVVTRTKRGAIDATHLEVQATETASSCWNWSDFQSASAQSSLPESEKNVIAKVFRCLMDAETQVHGDSEAQHLHELGSLDTLIDVVGTVAGLRILGVEAVYSSPLPASVGFSSSSHGVHASLAPATMQIISENRIPIRASGGNCPVGESITPTGAALVASLASFKSVEMTVESTGYGAGTRESDTPPNVAGIWLGDAIRSETDFTILAEKIGVDIDSETVLLETNLDDMTGEELGCLTQKLMNNGSLDVWITPIQMKKNRPGTLLSVLVRKVDAESAASSIFLESSTLGLRVREVQRLVARRELVTVQTELGPVRIKLKKIDGRVVGASPEYEDCAEISDRLGLTLREVQGTAYEAARKVLPLDKA